jgi:hypothetical protein
LFFHLTDFRGAGLSLLTLKSRHNLSFGPLALPLHRSGTGRCRDHDQFILQISDEKNFLVPLLVNNSLTDRPGCRGTKNQQFRPCEEECRARLGVGSKAKATVTLNDGSKVKGYIYNSADDDFVIRDRKTDAPTTIRYADVKSVADNRGHHNAKLVLILVGIGAAVTVAAVFGSILANER